MSLLKVLSRSPEDTVEAGQRLGRLLGPGSTVCLYGDLGAGKTTMVKGIGKSLGLSERDVTSASFTIIAEYETEPPFYHIDLYRVENAADLEAVGLYEYIDGEGIAVVEWAERMQAPHGAVKVTVELLEEDVREIIIEGIHEKDWDNQQA